MRSPNIRRRTVLGASTAATMWTASGRVHAKSTPSVDRPSSVSAPRADYSSEGVYLDYLTRSNIAGGSNVRFDSGGVILVQNGSAFVYNPTTIAQFGLQQYSFYVTNGSAAALHAAVVQAGWLVAHQNSATGCWTYAYPFSVGAMSETLPAGWSSAMAQGQAMSLLTRIYKSYPTKSAYLTSAKRAVTPLLLPVSEGGLAATFQGLPYLEEYPTKSAHTLALNGFMFSLLGLYDLAHAGHAPASVLLDPCMNTLRTVLPCHDMVTTSAYHLGHLTKPTRPVHHAAHYHRVHVTELDALHSVMPHRTLGFYADLWRTYPDMNPTTWSVPRRIGGSDISALG